VAQGVGPEFKPQCHKKTKVIEEEEEEKEGMEKGRKRRKRRRVQAYK
jgi:hypothetical protein